jgi:NDP-sugar pyrophosphorylase family protein
VLVINSDIITKINISNFYEYHQNNNADITICSKKYKIIVPYGVLNISKNKVLNIVEKPKFE